MSLLLCMAVALAGSEAAEPRAEELQPLSLDFAESLFLRSQHEAAWLELERVAYYTDDAAVADRARFRAGEALWALGRDQEAADHFEQVAPLSLAEHRAIFALAAAESRYRLGDHDAVIRQLEALGQPGESVHEQARYRQAWALLREGGDEGAAAALTQVQGALAEPAGHLARELRDADPLPRRSPAAAGVMSALLPGAGQLYAQEPRDGLTALIVTGLFGFATYELARRELWGGAAVTGTFGVGFYSGNILSAVNSARRFNRDRARARMEALEARYELHLALDPDEFALEASIGGL